MSARTLVLATRNEGKIAEIRDLLAGFDVEVISLSGFPGVPEIVEDGETFLDNALKKARMVAKITGHLALADDSGLEVDALEGAPGVRSARYAGEGATDRENYEKLLAALKGVPSGQRGARFRCVLVLADPSGRWTSTEGVCEGRIAEQPAGEFGFGYDPVFLLPGTGLTMAQIVKAEKNRLSHRGKALSRLGEIFEPFLKGEIHGTHDG